MVRICLYPPFFHSHYGYPVLEHHHRPGQRASHLADSRLHDCTRCGENKPHFFSRQVNGLFQSAYRYRAHLRRFRDWRKADNIPADGCTAEAAHLAVYLHELEYTVSKLPGVGKAVSSQLKNLGILTLADLLMHYPRSYENRTEKVPLSAVYKEPEGLWVNTAVTVILHDYFYVKGKQTLKIHVEDDTSGAVLICFNRRFLSGRLLPGQRYFIYGFFQVRYGEIQSSRFETADFSENPGDFNAILPLYPLSGSLNQGNM
ncbi:MAG: hypothetical protein E4H36_13295, partial [Spirochaetales bacterium]